MLHADKVSFAYDGGRTPVLQDVSITIDRGAIVGLLGPNGSGKTTLLRVLAGMLRPLSGTVTLEGAALATRSRKMLAREIAVVPQETHTTFDFTVLDMVLMGRFPHLGAFELEGARDFDVARAALAATGTAELEQRQFSTLSGGEKQRVVIAGALAQEADLLLLDEPTASLDVSYQFETAALLSRLNRDRGTTMVVSTHDLNLAAAFCDRIVLLKRGRVLAHGPTRDVLTAEAVRAVYGMEADVQYHERAGHLTVVPISRALESPARPSPGTP